MRRIVLGGGCFWCTEAIYLSVKGIVSVASSYAGGNRPNPNYEMICTGVSGYAEVVDMVYDEEIISLAELLDIFFATHNPTTLNQQGADRGTQYRSVIYYANKEEQEIINAAIFKNQKKCEEPIVTEVSPLPKIVYIAESYHQNYYANHQTQGYCQMVIAPKLNKLISTFAEKLT